MQYIVVDDVAFVQESIDDTAYCVPISTVGATWGQFLWNKAYELDEVEMSQDETEHVAHILVHLQQLVELQAEYTQSGAFVK
jgi:hypothetical protein